MAFKSILNFNGPEMLAYWMQSTEYLTVELPEYFSFDEVLASVQKSIGDTPYEECLAKTHPEQLTDVNLDLILSKDGHYGIRQVSIVNPYLYYILARQLCKPSAWKSICNCFEACKVTSIEVASIPVVRDKKENFKNSTTILSWWNAFEQRSIELSLEFSHMFVTDITNCYGEIVPDAITNALARTNTAKATNKNNALADDIRHLLAAMQHGRNIGIPQAGAMFDLIAELVLAYSDLLLHERLEQAGIPSDSYRVVRYRDDYRVFACNASTLEKISYIMLDVLRGLNFRLNTSKTRLTQQIVTNAVKPDKSFYIFNTPILNKKGCDFDGLQKHLLYILMFSEKFPNSGQLKRMLADFNARLKQPREGGLRTVGKITFGDDGPKFQKTDKKEDEKPTIIENHRAMIAIAVSLALNNAAILAHALRTISLLLDTIKDEDERRNLAQLVVNRMADIPNSDYAQVWLQTITYPFDRQSGDIDRYTMRLCKLVNGTSKELWNNSWLKSKFTRNLPIDSIVDHKKLGDSNGIITFHDKVDYIDKFTLSAEQYEILERLQNEADYMP